jgi:hypothetical protein
MRNSKLHSESKACDDHRAGARDIMRTARCAAGA